MEQNEHPEIQTDQLVSRLAPDPNAGPPNLRVMIGWIGASDRDDRIRIYTVLDFSEYVEVANSEVAHIERHASAVEPSVVWLRSTAPVTVTRTPQRESQQLAFLQGSLTSRFLGSATRLGMSGFGGLLGIKSIPPQVSVCSSCPTDGGEHTCVPAVCTLATSCLTTVPTDPGCG